MNRYVMVALGLFVGLGLMSAVFATERVVVCEEAYSET